jgi:hypothetical protein
VAVDWVVACGSVALTGDGRWFVRQVEVVTLTLTNFVTGGLEQLAVCIDGVGA